MSEERASNRVSQITASMSGGVIDAPLPPETTVAFSRKLNRTESEKERDILGGCRTQAKKELSKTFAVP